MKDRKKPMPQAEMSRLMLVREAYHECGKDHNVCVVLPDGKSHEQIFGGYLPAMRQRMTRRNVTVTTLAGLTVEHIDNNMSVVDLSEIIITL